MCIWKGSLWVKIKCITPYLWFPCLCAAFWHAFGIHGKFKSIAIYSHRIKNPVVTRSNNFQASSTCLLLVHLVLWNCLTSLIYSTNSNWEHLAVGGGMLTLKLLNTDLNTFPSATSVHAVADRILWAACSEEERGEVVCSLSTSEEGSQPMDEEVRDQIAFPKCCLRPLYFVFLLLNRRSWYCYRVNKSAFPAKIQQFIGLSWDVAECSL